MESKIFVVIVTWNAMQWIDKCLSSLSGSKVSLFVIIVDNNSEDGTVDFIKKKYPDAELIHSKKNLGFGKANNIGLQKAYRAGAEHILLLNQDAWIENGAIEKLVVAQKKNPQYGVLSPIHLNGKGDALDLGFSQYIAPPYCPNLYSDIYTQQIKDDIYEIVFVNAAAWLISRDCIETVGGFNPAFFHYGEDVNYLHRLKFHKMKVGIYPYSRIFHDREQRLPNIYFKEKEMIFNREKTLFYANPFTDKKIQSEINQLRSLMLKSLIKLDLKSCLFFKKQLKSLLKLKPVVELTKKQSIVKGLSFLSE